MKLKSFIYILTGCVVMGSLGCKKFVEDGDVNINPNQSSRATVKTLLPALIEATATNHYSVAYSTSMFSQQMAAYQGGPINDDKNIDVRMSAFLGLYQSGMTNNKLLLDMATAQDLPHYSAIAKILMVLNLSLATDTYGDVPFSEAFKAPQVLYPAYDSQESLYTLMQRYLDEAIVEAQSTTPGIVTVAGDDLVYGGQMEKWVKMAWFLKARLTMHLTKKGAKAAADNALTYLQSAFSSAADDCQLVYNSRNFNPWSANVAKRVETGNFLIAPSRRFTDLLNGVLYGFVDPRLTLMMDKRNSASYSGLENGVGSGGTVDLTQNTFYGKENAPLFFATFAEQKLMEAEARFLSEGGTTQSTGASQEAYDAYLAGIRTHMTKIGVGGAAVDSYLADTEIAPGAADITLGHIMKEKHIALYLHPEAWVDVRRYDYNPDLFPGMALPQNQAPAMNGMFIRRSGLPNEELSRNPTAANYVKPLTENVWWDQ